MVGWFLKLRYTKNVNKYLKIGDRESSQYFSFLYTPRSMNGCYARCAAINATVFTFCMLLVFDSIASGLVYLQSNKNVFIQIICY